MTVPRALWSSWKRCDHSVCPRPLCADLPFQTDKRDYLINLEKSAQTAWQKSKIFDADPPPLPEGTASYADFFSTHQSMDDVKAKHPKWFGTFAYPYMNGSLHLGHAFTVFKVEFAAGFERMRGKRVLFPLGYHATGMPIKVGMKPIYLTASLMGYV